MNMCNCGDLVKITLNDFTGLTINGNFTVTGNTNINNNLTVTGNTNIQSLTDNNNKH